MRFLSPVEIAFNQAIFVAVIGLLVNGVSVFILGDAHEDHDHDEDGEDHDHHHDHNLRSAYLHVLADALTSVLAIFALLAAKYFHTLWMDPLMGIVGAVLVSRWSLGLLRATANILLDRQGPETVQAKIRNSIEASGEARISDLHLWFIGPNLYGVILQVLAEDPKPPAYYKKLLPANLKLAHVSVEVNPARR
jgi:cation diffusion facilitator family transporter